MSDVSAKSKEIESLRKEIERLNKVVEALIEHSEEKLNDQPTSFGVFQTTLVLEDQVRSRTQELEEALRKNEKITRALQQAKMQIEHNEQHLRDIASSLGEGLLVLTAEGMINFINLAACKMLGWREDEVLGKNAHDIFHHTCDDGTPCSIAACPQLAVSRTGVLYTSDDDYYWRADGTKFPVIIIATPISLQDNTTGVVIAFRDTTKAREERDWLKLMQSAIEHSPISVLITDQNAKIIYTNPQVTQTTGYSSDELHGHCTSIFRSGKTSAQVYNQMWKTILAGEVWRGELLDRRKDGDFFWEALSIAPVADDHGVIKYFVGVAEDITEKKKMQSLLQEMSFHDSLTGIANRRRFDEYFGLEWRRAQRTSRPLALVMADIDFFKKYNDKFGHQAGDECLQRVAKALESKVDRGGDMLARYGGEEFVCILPETDLAGAKYIAETMRVSVLALKIPHPDSAVSDYVTISLGVACVIGAIRNDASKVLLGAADKALYLAKSLGRNRVESIDTVSSN